MPEINKENILCGRIENNNYAVLSIISDKIKVLIIGGGRAGFIKANTFVKKGAMVTVLSKEFCNDFTKIEYYPNIKLITGEYKHDYLIKNHLIVIAINDYKMLQIIKKHCDKLCKLYLDCSNFKEGLFLLPCQRGTKTTTFGLNTIAGSPKTSRYISEKMKDIIKEYDPFIEYSYKIRNSIKGLKNMSEIMGFISSDDFYFFYKKNKHKHILRIFYPEISFSE